MESAFMDYHGKYNQGDFLERVMMPAFRTAFTSVPVAVFANLEPYNGTYEDDKTLNNFLIIAVQRAGFGDNRFSNLKDDNEKASVLALFCATPANTMPYTMDSRRGEM
ncbi:MAG: hypothetical protein CL961_00185 [Euryarchaeota archaeon]|nr:hypothetical protein [Euryarchaeota archaeon]|tara:strand:+ start:172 stop:495 length:324 start_codon:yes stop_codon:yes gene_type:complete